MNLKEAVELSLHGFLDIQECESIFYAKGRVKPIIDYLRAALAEDAMKRLSDEQQMIERGTKAWAGVPDATAWVEDLRGNEPVTDCHEKEGDKLAPTLDVPETNFGNMAQAVDSIEADHIADANKMVTTHNSYLLVQRAALAEAYRCGRDDGVKAEREECAKLCDAEMSPDPLQPTTAHMAGQYEMAEYLGQVIRQRGEK